MGGTRQGTRQAPEAPRVVKSLKTVFWWKTDKPLAFPLRGSWLCQVEDLSEMIKRALSGSPSL